MRETRVPLERRGDIHLATVPGIAAGQRYGFRAYGDWSVAQGRFFDPTKLLVDPYAKLLDSGFRFHADLSEPGRDTAAWVLPRASWSRPHSKPVLPLPTAFPARRPNLRAQCPWLFPSPSRSAPNSARHHRGVGTSRDNFPLSEATRKRDRTHADRGMDRRTAPAAIGAPQCLGLQSRGANGPRSAACARRTGRIARHRSCVARGGYRRHPRSSPESHWRKRYRRSDPEPARTGQSLLCPGARWQPDQ